MCGVSNDDCPQADNQISRRTTDKCKSLTCTFLTQSDILSCLDHALQCCKPEVAFVPVASGEKHLFLPDGYILVASNMIKLMHRNFRHKLKFAYYNEMYLDLECSSKITTVQGLTELDKLFSSILGYVTVVKFGKQSAKFSRVVFYFTLLSWICTRTSQYFRRLVVQSCQGSDDRLLVGCRKYMI